MDYNRRCGGSLRLMIDLLTASLSLLRENRFATRLTQLGSNTVVSFEDDSLLGFVNIFDTPGDMIRNWKAAEQSFLLAQATKFRTAGEKAWNVYCVLLCGAPGDAHEIRQIGWIEEDLERTRKLAACGTATRSDLSKALLPLLSLQQRPVLQSEKYEDRLRRRIKQIAPSAAEAVLEQKVTTSEVVRLLRENS
jgi:hypothetical protein